MNRTKRRSGDLAFADVLPLLLEIPHDENVILIGGQALNFWAEQSGNQLSEFAPFTSSDLDFMGDAPAAANCASRWHGKLMMPKAFEPVPVSAAVELSFAGKKRYVQFLSGVFGLGVSEATKSAERVEVAGTTFAVLDPVACLESRVHNLYGLPGRHTEASLQRVRLAIRVVCHRIQAVADSNPRAALRMAERVLELARSNHALKLFVHDRQDILEAIPRSGMPAGFYVERLSRAEKWLSNRRERYRALINRSTRDRSGSGTRVKKPSQAKGAEVVRTVPKTKT